MRPMKDILLMCLCCNRPAPGPQYNPSMCGEQDRLDSFDSWSLSVVTPAELAKAGFYYLGEGDRVACFACGGQLSNWEPGNRVASEHRRHYPKCRFLLRGAGADVSPRGAAAEAAVALQGVAVTDLHNVSNPASQGEVEFVHRNKEELPTVEEEQSWEFVDPPAGEAECSGGDAVTVNNPVIKSALEMGFERSLVEETVQTKMMAGGQNYKTVQELVSAMLRAEERAREEAERELEKLLRCLRDEVTLACNTDVLGKDIGDECCVCLDDMLQGETIARLSCLCVYHKNCIDAWAKVKPCCPEHPL